LAPDKTDESEDVTSSAFCISPSTDDSTEDEDDKESPALVTSK
jgi:hypothetical protein